MAKIVGKLIFYYKRKWEMGTMETDFYFGQG